MLDTFKLKWFFYNIKYRIKYYSLFGDTNHSKKENITVFIIEHSRVYPGIADIIKSIVGSYYISKLNKKQFKIIFENPFVLSDYLEPNKINWFIKKTDLNYSYKDTLLVNYRGIGNNIKYPSNKKQYHIYNFLGINILQRNKIHNWKFLWHELFCELFKPTQLLKDSLEIVPYKENNYIAVHIRFVNALEVIESSCLSWSKPLSGQEKEELLTSVFKVMDGLEKKYANLLVFSDSNEFLKIAKERGYHSLPGKVGHVGYQKSDDVILKTFVDWYAIARATEIYRITGKRLYNSAFPLYASLIGDKPYHEITI